MGLEDDILALIDLIYEAAFDSTLWPEALTRLADTMRTAHIGMHALDTRAQTYDSIAPLTDPVMSAIYKQHWAFRNPVWSLSAKRPAGEVYLLDSLIPREDFTATPVFNEWFRPAKFGLAMISSNLFIGDRASALITAANSPGKDEITSEQASVFKAAVPHINRAVRIHRDLQLHALGQDTAPDRLECLSRSVMLVDGAARVLFANAAARTLLCSRGGLTVSRGCLHSTDGSAALQGLIASCGPEALALNGCGGQMSIHRGAGQPSLRVTVTPLRAKGTVAQLPWLGFGIPVALVTVADPAREKRIH